MNLNDLRMSLKAAMDNMWARIDARIHAIEEGGGGGGVTGVKGDAEASYRQGNVNLTPANIGAAKQQATDWYTMFDLGFGASTGQSLSSYQGRRFTQWGISDPMLVTTIVADNWVRQTIMVPLSTFQQYRMTFKFTVAGVSKYVDVQYVSDTGISVDSDTSGLIRMQILYNS